MIRPLADRVVIEVKELEQKTSGGIIIATKQEPSQEGTVMAVGPGTILENGETVPVGVSIGDFVMFQKFAGTHIQYDGKDYLIMHESDIIAVL